MGKSIRERKLEEMLEGKVKTEDEIVAHQFRANPIPKTTTDNLYDKIC